MGAEKQLAVSLQGAVPTQGMGVAFLTLHKGDIRLAALLDRPSPCFKSQLCQHVYSCLSKAVLSVHLEQSSLINCHRRY